ncbi:MAG: alpha/beta hydrolase [Sulfurifustis sp.]
MRKFYFGVLAIAMPALLLLTGRAAAAQSYFELLNQTYSASAQTLDLYVPAAPRKKTALIFIHGGAFVLGQKEDMQGYAKLYAQGGFVSTTINYRLAPQAVFPAALDDVQAAVHWLKQRGGAYGYETPQKVVLIGYSAGANLALMAGLADQSGVAGVVSAAAPSDLRSLLASTPYQDLKDDLNAYLAGADPDVASPLYQASAGDPPVLLSHGQLDMLVPVSQSVAMAQRLQDAHVPVSLRIFPNVGHEILLPNPSLSQLIDEMTKFILGIEAST